MKPIVRRGLGLLLIIACIAVWIVSSGMSRRSRSVVTCKGKETLDVRVLDSLSFVAGEDVEKWLDSEYGAYAGQRLDSVNLAKIESLILSHSAVKTCEAWLTDDGTLHIELTQRQPAVRFDTGSNGYYADAEGFIFPLQSRGTADVPVVDGKIPLQVTRGFKGVPADPAQRLWLGKILELARVAALPEWKERIGKITVGDDGNLVIKPVQGKETFLLGPPDRIEEKFSLMDKYYSAIVSAKGPEYYTTVDVRYRGQLVCKK